MYGRARNDLLILFLDFDGVLHHWNVMVERTPDRKRIPIMEGPGELFQWVPHLEAALAAYPDTKIILSTKWVWWFGIEYCRDQLPASLAAKVIGATWEGGWVMPEGWSHWDRCRQIRFHAEKYQIERWFAIDDDDRGLASDDREHWVITPVWLGVSDPLALQQIVEHLGN